MDLGNNYANRNGKYSPTIDSITPIYSPAKLEGRSDITPNKSLENSLPSISEEELSIDISIKLRKTTVVYNPNQLNYFKDEKTPSQNILEEIAKKAEEISYKPLPKLLEEKQYWHVKPSRRFGKTRRAKLGMGFYGWTNTATGQTEINENLYGGEFEKVLGHEDRHDSIGDEKKNREATDTVSNPSLY